MHSKTSTIPGFLAFLTATLYLLLVLDPTSNLLINGSLCNGIDFFPTADIFSNAYFYWRIDPLTCGIAKTSLPVINLNSLEKIYYLIFFAGLSLFNTSLRHSSKLSSLFISITSTIIIYLFFAGNITVISLLAWSPWYLWSIYSEKINNSNLRLSFTIIFSLLLFFAAQQLIILVLFLPLIIDKQGNFKLHFTKQQRIIAVLTTLFSLGIKLPKIPNYPPLARLIEDDGIAGMIRPLLGPDSPLEIISRSVVISSYGSAILFISVCSLFVLFQLKTPLRYLILLWATALIIEVSGSAELAALSPIQALTRIIPGLFAFPTAIYLSVLLLIYLANFSQLKLKSKLILLILILLGTQFKSGSNQRLQLWQQQTTCGTPLECITKAAAANSRIISPSLNLYIENGPSLANSPEIFTAENQFKLTKDNAFISASHHNQERFLRRILDNSPATRWSTRLGQQTGKEWIFIRTNQALQATGIELAIGKFKADFPRGLKIYGTNVCPEDISQPLEWMSKNAELYNRQEPWQGAIDFTENGFPYYSAQSNVRSYFGDEKTVQCLLIQQTGLSSNFEWSVTEISLLN
ncbi:MAG: hypothetical protein R3A13_06820 [Bdellovibrionota bacterium]